jgi:hypothetical protein
MTQASCCVERTHPIETESREFSRLRAKTDRQLAAIVHSKLAEASELTLAAGREMAEQKSDGAREFLDRASCLVGEAQLLLLALDPAARRPFEPAIEEASSLISAVAGGGEAVNPR